MKRLLSLLILSASLLLTSGCNSKNTNKTPSNAERLYNDYCIGCHNDNKSPFVNRQWLFGNSKDEIINSIKLGRISYGMPAFEKGLTDKEIEQLADYILTLSESETKETTEPSASAEIHKSEVQSFRVDTVVSGLDVPWGLEFLPNDQLLISERSGALLLFTTDGQLITINNSPQVFAKGQGGLLDLELHPQYEENGWIYIAYSSPDEDNSTIANTAIIRARLQGSQLTDIEFFVIQIKR